MFETNVLSVVALSKVIVKGMLIRNSGHVVNMSSIAGLEAYGGEGLAAVVPAHLLCQRQHMQQEAALATGAAHACCCFK